MEVHFADENVLICRNKLCQKVFEPNEKQILLIDTLHRYLCLECEKLVKFVKDVDSDIQEKESEDEVPIPASQNKVPISEWDVVWGKAIPEIDSPPKKKRKPVPESSPVPSREKKDQESMKVQRNLKKKEYAAKKRSLTKKEKANKDNTLEFERLLGARGVFTCTVCWKQESDSLSRLPPQCLQFNYKNWKCFECRKADK